MKINTDLVYKRCNSSWLTMILSRKISGSLSMFVGGLLGPWKCDCLTLTLDDYVITCFRKALIGPRFDRVILHDRAVTIDVCFPFCLLTSTITILTTPYNNL